MKRFQPTVRSFAASCRRSPGRWRISATLRGTLFYVCVVAPMMGSDALAQSESMVPWMARVWRQDAPVGVSGILTIGQRGLLWDRGTGARSFAYQGSITHVSSIVEVGPDRVILAGIDAAGIGALDLVKLDPELGFRVLESQATGSMRPLKGVYNSGDGRLYLTDFRAGALVYTTWRAEDPLPRPKDWVTALTSKVVSLLRPGHPFTDIEAAPKQGVLLWSPWALGSKMWVHHNGSTWVAESAHPQEPDDGQPPVIQAQVRHGDPVEVDGPLEVISSVGGQLVLESRSKATNLPLGTISAGTTAVSLPAASPLDLADRYRFVLRSPEQEAVSSGWFKPVKRIGERGSFGQGRFVDFNITEKSCYQGSSRFGMVGKLAPRPDGAVTLVAWYGLERDDRALAVATVGDSEIKILMPDLACAHPTNVPASRAESELGMGVRFLIPSESGGQRFFVQMAVLGPGPGDLALSEILGCAVDATPSKYPQMPEQVRGVEEYWEKWGISRAQFSEWVLHRVRQLVAERRK